MTPAVANQLNFTTSNTFRSIKNNINNNANDNISNDYYRRSSNFININFEADDSDFGFNNNNYSGSSHSRRNNTRYYESRSRDPPYR
jgi:hypothetical protein